MRYIYFILLAMLYVGCASGGVDQEKQTTSYDYDSEWLPIIEIRPMYPTSALEEEISGWVVTEFTVNERGRIEDVKVIDSHPANVFDQSAVRAMSNFLYKARKLNGVAVATQGLTCKFVFDHLQYKVTNRTEVRCINEK